MVIYGITFHLVGYAPNGIEYPRWVFSDLDTAKRAYGKYWKEYSPIGMVGAVILEVHETLIESAIDWENVK